MNDIKKERFFKVYANLPLNIRREIILVVKNEPITWQVAYLEISHNTKLGEQILKKIASLKFI